MKEIADKLNNLVAVLEHKIANNDEMSKELSLESSLIKESKSKNEAKENELIAREKNIKNIEDVVLLSNQAKERLAESNKINKETQFSLEKIKADRNSILLKEEELKKMVALYRAKNESLEKEKVQLEIDRKEMRVKIIEDLKKLK